ncbi:MAG: aryl-sulfate sulfotransferase, partial [Crocinitomicaceae bacterium]|nr:aryl-sulfate sulfotransferase [Crocinitomicaceae bacterium]
MKNSLLLSCVFTFVFAWSSFGQTFDGYALYNLQNENVTYLIDKNQNIAHSWSCTVACNYTVLLKPNGNIVRGGKYGSNQLTGAAIGGMVQEIDPSGNVVWEYVYSDANHCSHHDLTLLDNGNVILTAWEVKTTAECTQAGVDSPSTDQWPTHFIELQQNGASADIVWEWHMWDHMIQDHDGTKDNFGVIADHPELMDINL